MTPDEAAARDKLAGLYETARLSVLHGVSWSGSYGDMEGVSKDEALDDAATFLQALVECGGIRSVVERDALRADLAQARAREQAVLADLAQADAFGRGEFRVTTWAYEQALRVMREAKAQVAAVREQHPRESLGDFEWCAGCTLPNARSHVEWPCPTIQALDAAALSSATPQEGDNR